MLQKTICIRVLLTFLMTVRLCLSQEAQLVISPARVNQTVALDSSFIITCKAIVASPERVTDMKWWGPNRQPIPEESSSRVFADSISPEENALGLFIQHVKEADRGQYNCTATYAKVQKLNAYVELSTYLPITWEDAPIDQYSILDTEYTIKCLVRASPNAIVDWLRNKEGITPEGRYVIRPEGLLIKNVNMRDEGVYTCRARVIQTGQLEQRDIRLEVQIPPLFKDPLPPMEVVEGESTTISCKAEGKPDPSYTWVNKRGEDVSTLGRFTVNKFTGIVSITSIQKDDGGNYKCLAENGAGTAERSLAVNVILKPKIEEFLNISVKVGEEAILICKASGDPLPEVTFRKQSNPLMFQQGEQPADERITVESLKIHAQRMSVGKLIISELMRTDDGLYSCVASNKGAKEERTGHLTVEFPPSLANTPQQEAWSWNNNAVNLTCVAESIPNATIIWEYRDRIVGQGEEGGRNMQQVGYGPSSMLKITPSDTWYYGTYLCKATNKHGTDQAEIKLVQANVPGPILQATLDFITATTISFKFIGPSDDGGLPIQNYGCEYKEDRQYWDEASRRTWPIDVPYIVENLEPQRTYNFRFAAKNDVGFSAWYGPQTHTMPKRSAPEEPNVLATPIGGVIRTPYPDKYEMRWGVPPDNGEPIDFFEITYYIVRNSSESWISQGDVEKVQVVHPGNVVYELRGLRPDSYYKVELRAHNNIGYSTPAHIVVKTAQGDLLLPESNTQGTILATGVIIGVVLGILLIILVIVDVSCFFVNRAGILMAICNQCRKKSDKSDTKYKKSKNELLHDQNSDPNKDDIVIAEVKLSPETVPMMDKEENGIKNSKKELSVYHNSPVRVNITKHSDV